MCLACGADRVDHDASFRCVRCRAGTPSPHVVLWSISGPDAEGRFVLREWAKDEPGDDLARLEHDGGWADLDQARSQLPRHLELAGRSEGEEFWFDPSDDQAVPKPETH